jgi:hypothetical protein
MRFEQRCTLRSRGCVQQPAHHSRRQSNLTAREKATTQTENWKDFSMRYGGNGPFRPEGHECARS